MSIFTVSKGTKRLILGLLVFSVLYLGGMGLYYHHQNSAADPRVMDARLELKTVQAQVGERDWDGALAALDRADAIYSAQPAYQESFERGVVENDRAAVYLLVLEDHLVQMDPPRLDEQGQWLLEQARRHGRNAEAVYAHWIAENGSADAQTLRRRIAPHFSPEALPGAAGADAERVLERRVQELLEAQVETPRRLSVTLTNLGIMARYAGDGPLAAERYQQALELWPANDTAAANLARLRGEPHEGPSTLEQLFPPERLPDHGAAPASSEGSAHTP